MSDISTVDAPEAETVEEQPDAKAEPTDDPAVLRAQLEKARKDAAGYRTKLREAEPFVTKARELEEASKTDTQRLTERAETAEKANGPLQAENARLRVALTKNLTGDKADLVDRLRGETVEELEADADRLLKLFGKPSPGNGDGGARDEAREGSSFLTNAIRAHQR